MAITNSIAIGTGRRKLGEIVLSTVKGRTIARKYQPNVANPNTPMQQAARARMRNCVMMWGLIGNFCKGAFRNRKKYQSEYNAFVSANVSTMDELSYQNAWDILSNKPQVRITNGQLGLLNMLLNTPSSLEVDITGVSMNLREGDILRVAEFETSNKSVSYQEHVLTGSDISGGVIYLSVMPVTGNLILAYIVTADRKKSTTSIGLYT
jgi:hypothetical protein